MAGAKGGGSWKVAYADFVTAMMAFFLVMWIGAQDSKVRQSVANYFVDPSGVDKRPANTGSVMDSLTTGSVANEHKTAMGQGRQSYTKDAEASPASKVVSLWIHSDPENARKWKAHAQACREAALKASEVKNQTASVQEYAIRELSKQLRQSVATHALEVKGVQQDLFLWSLTEVNWGQLAEELLGG